MRVKREYAIVAPEARLARIPLRRVEERLIQAVSGLDQPPAFVAIERLECGHKLTIHPQGDPLTAKYRRCKQCEVAAPPRVSKSGSGNRILWRNLWRNRPVPATPLQDLTESLEDSELKMASSMLRLIVSDSEESADESTDEHTPTLESAITYLNREAQLAQSENEKEDFSIALCVLALLRDWSSELSPFDVACGYAVGLPHARYLHRRAARTAFMRKELLRAIPDYDYSNEMPPERDPTDGRRKYHGNRFDRRSDLDTSPSSRHDASGIGCEDGDHAATSGRVGDRTNTHGCPSTPSRARSAGRTSVPDAYRGSAPKSIRSHAQILALATVHKRRRALATLHRRKRAGAAYFGA